MKQHSRRNTSGSNRLSRREFLTGGLALVGAGVPTLSLASEATDLFSVERIDIPVVNLPDAFAGYTIGFLSDIHLSAFLKANLLEEIIAFLKKTDLDILLLGGDYLWRPRERLRDLFPIHRNEFSSLDDPQLSSNIYKALTAQLAEIKPRDGTMAILGNHDRWAAAQTCETAFIGSPITLLINDSRLVKRSGKTLEIIGTDDFVTGQPRFPRAINPADVRILLTHNPDILRWYLGRERLRFDVALMGHTHGGQICIAPGVPISYNIDSTEYGAGLVRHPSGCQCYTTRGIGCVGIPLRLNCPPEVALLKLVPPP